MRNDKKKTIRTFRRTLNTIKRNYMSTGEPEYAMQMSAIQDEMSNAFEPTRHFKQG